MRNCEYKILYLPSGRILSQSIVEHSYNTSDYICDTFQQAKNMINCIIRMNMLAQYTKGSWYSYNEILYPTIKEHFEIIEYEI